MKTEQKFLLLKVEQHNWGFMQADNWSSSVWYIYSNRSYKRISYYLPSMEEYYQRMELVRYNSHEETYNRISRYGKISEKRYSRVMELLSSEQWRNTEKQIKGCDGSAWEIEQYSEDGSLVRTSGDVDYIYGNSILESLVSLMPGVNGNHSSAYIRRET